MNRMEYVAALDKLMSEHNGNENHPAVTALNNKFMSAVGIANASNGIDNSNQANQAQSTAVVSNHGYSDSEEAELEWLAERAESNRPSDIHIAVDYLADQYNEHEE